MPNKEFYTPQGLLDFDKLDAVGLSETDRLELGQLEKELTQYLSQVEPALVENIEIGREPFAGQDEGYIRETQRRIDDILERYGTPPHLHGVGEPGGVDDETREKQSFSQASVVLGFLEPPPEVKFQADVPKDVAIALWNKAVTRLQGKENYGAAIKIYRIYLKRFQTGEWTKEDLLGAEAPVEEGEVQVYSPKALLARVLDIAGKYDLKVISLDKDRVGGEWTVTVEGDISLFSRPDYTDIENEMSSVGVAVSVRRAGRRTEQTTGPGYKPVDVASDFGDQLDIEFGEPEKTVTVNTESKEENTELSDKKYQLFTALEQMFTDMNKKQLRKYMDEISGKLDWSQDLETILKEVMKLIYSAHKSSLVKEAIPGQRTVNLQRHRMQNTPWGGLDEDNAVGTGVPHPSRRNRPGGYLSKEEAPSDSTLQKPVTADWALQDDWLENARRDFKEANPQYAEVDDEDIEVDEDTGDVYLHAGGAYPLVFRHVVSPLNEYENKFGSKKIADSGAYNTISRMHQYVDEGKGEFPYAAHIGNWTFDLDANYVLHVIYHDTEVVTADFKNKVVTNVTTGGWDTVSTKRGIQRVLQAFERVGYEVPEVTDYEYKQPEGTGAEEYARENWVDASKKLGAGTMWVIKLEQDGNTYYFGNNGENTMLTPEIEYADAYSSADADYVIKNIGIGSITYTDTGESVIITSQPTKIQVQRVAWRGSKKTGRAGTLPEEEPRCPHCNWPLTIRGGVCPACGALTGSVKTASIYDDLDLEGLFGGDGTMPDLKERMEDARRRTTSNYKEVVATTADLLGKVTDKMKGIFLCSSSIMKVQVDDFDKLGFCKDGVAVWRADLEEPQARVKKAAFFTFKINGGEAVAPMEFNDSIGRVYPCNEEGVRDFFELKPEKEAEEIEFV